MIQFRVTQETRIEWSDDSGETWHAQDEHTPKPVLSAWWALLVAVGMRTHGA